MPAHAHPARQDQRAAEDDLSRFVDELSREYFAVVENILEHSGSVSAKAYGLALARLDNDINDFDLRLGLGGRVKLIQRARHVTNQFLLAYAGKLFAVVESSVSSKMRGCGQGRETRAGDKGGDKGAGQGRGTRAGPDKGVAMSGLQQCRRSSFPVLLIMRTHT